MATFYVLPPRSVLAERWGHFWSALFPGLSLNNESPVDLVERIEALIGHQPDTFIVYRDDLSVDCDLESALRDGFGAEWGDQVVEVRFAGPHRPIPVRVATFRLDPCSEPALLCYNALSD
mgnify:CR=1 FL=1